MVDRYTRQTINYQALPTAFSLIVTDVESKNVNFLKELYRKVLIDYEITQRFECQPGKNNLFSSTVFAFSLKRKSQRGKSTNV